MTDDSKAYDVHDVLKAVVGAGVDEFAAEVMIVIRDDKGKVRIGASEAAGLSAQAILSQSVRKVSDTEKQDVGVTMEAFVRTAAEVLGNDQVVLIVWDHGEVRLAVGAGAQSPARLLISDALVVISESRR